VGVKGDKLLGGWFDVALDQVLWSLGTQSGETRINFWKTNAGRIPGPGTMNLLPHQTQEIRSEMRPGSAVEKENAVSHPKFPPKPGRKKNRRHTVIFSQGLRMGKIRIPGK
jgi:hypothetical protein